MQVITVDSSHVGDDRIPIRAEALETQESRRKTGSIYQLIALGEASAFLTVYEKAECVIGGMLPRLLYRRRGSSTSSSDAAITSRWSHTKDKCLAESKSR